MAESEFYGNAKTYWQGVSPTVDGMLGGFSHISSTDIGGSNKFLRHFIRGPKATTGSRRVLDCGAGIGRVTKLLLIPLFEEVDMVELSQEFLDKAPAYLGESASKVHRRICSGLQEFVPDPGYYDMIWCQWVLGHLTDEDFISFFQSCQKGLAKNGLIIVKENVCAPNNKDFDENDSSYTRSKSALLNLFEKAGLQLLQQEKQKNFPKDLYEVWMFALK